MHISLFPLRTFTLCMLFMPIGVYSQKLEVSETIQEQSQWCWTAVAACVLSYCGFTVSQCEIAEYTRTSEIFSDVDLGSNNCCQSPATCNKWNYIASGKGSIQDILNHFGGIKSRNLRRALTIPEIVEHIRQNKPFIIRWQYADGRGHFAVVHGIVDNRIHYMNPWPGEGFKTAEHAWLLSNGNRKWVNSLIITDTPQSPSDSIPNPPQKQDY